MTKNTESENRIAAASQEVSNMEAWLKDEIYVCYATRREGTGIALELVRRRLRRIQRILEQKQ